MYFESHAHYDQPAFDDDRDILLGNILPSAGISHIINIGSSMTSSRRCVDLTARFDYVYASVGVHPHNANDMADDDLEELAQMAAHPKITAIGEIGLDFHYDFSPRDVQRRRFANQLELAAQLAMPVIIHSREADDEVYEIIRAHSSRLVGGVIHCFPGDLVLARKYVEMGFLIGISGIVTYKNAAITQDTARGLPLSAILLETDCPYLSPIPNRGKRNDSRNLAYIAQMIAQLRGISADEVAEETAENAKRLFNIPNTF